MTTDIITRLQDMAADATRIWIEEHPGPAVTYRALLAETGRFATALAGLGVGAGDRVLVQVTKTAEVLTLYLACLRLGAVFLPVNPAYTLRETLYFLGDAEPSLALFDPPRLAELALEGITGPRLMTLSGGDDSFAARAATASPDFADPPHGPDDLAAILYTSGTTGRSKGVMLSRENLASNAAALTGLWRFDAGDVLLHALPVFHTHGLFVATNSVLWSGASMIFLPGFHVDTTLAAFARASVMMGVPTFYTRLLGDPRLTDDATRHIRLFISGSAPLSPATFDAWQARTGKPILERYGMTETNMITSNPHDGPRRAGTVGHPLPGVAVRITDPETGAPLPLGQIGAIEVEGPNVFRGYWRMPEQTARDFTPDGYFVTGDMGAFDDAGYLAILGRAKDLVITGGLNVYPAEVEAALDRQKGVAASAVIGVPHPDFGEAVVACIVVAGDAELRETPLRAALGAELAAFKIPKRILFLPDLPRNAMGKVQKAELRKTHHGLFTD